MMAYLKRKPQFIHQEPVWADAETRRGGWDPRLCEGDEGNCAFAEGDIFGPCHYAGHQSEWGLPWDDAGFSLDPYGNVHADDDLDDWGEEEKE